VTSSLGATLTPLIGRDRELRALESRLASGARLITLTGPGGSGKTTLAREVFGRLQRQGSAAYFVDLVGIGDPGLVPAEIAAELGVTETADLDAAAAVTARLRETAVVLVLDNLEELTGARTFLAGLLQATPGLQLMATSRIPLVVAGEVEFQVPPLDLPQGDEPAAVEGSPAGALFLERARAVGRLSEVDAPTAKAIARLCRRLDGLPLALELAAARTRILPPATILRHLADHTPGLLTKAGDADIRHKSLDAVLSWSLDLLDSNEAEVLSAVAICPGGFDLAIAEALAPHLNVLQAIDVLGTYGLLVQRTEFENEPWYQLLETIRVAAQERASEEATAASWRRLAAHVTERVADTLEAYFQLDEGTFRRLDALLGDVRAVLDWTEVNDPALNLSIAAQFAWYCLARGLCREGIERMGTALAANPEMSSNLAMAYHGLATLQVDRGSLHEARRAAAESVRIARMVGDVEREVDGLGWVVMLADTPDADAFRRLRDLLPKVEHPAVRYWGLSSLAWVEGLGSGFSEAVARRFRDAEGALSGTPYRRFQGAAASNLAWLCLYRNRPAEAFDHSTRALSAYGAAPPEMLAQAHSVRATAASSIGQLSEAIASLRLAIELGAPGSNGRWIEVVIAAVAVLTASDAPLLAAKAWGTMTAETLTEADRGLGERLLLLARRATDPVAYQLALKAGQKAGVAAVVDEALAYLDGVGEASAQAGPVRLQHGTLTQRELEVLALVGVGKTDADIAAELFISPKTASVHVSNAKAKIGLDTRLEVALWARERGLVDDERGDSSKDSERG
jgi:predicted ATPase/DNA-binding CsgD family transcriptional regulator